MTLRGESLSVRYHERRPFVLEGQSIALTPGRVTALVGPNGSGKSTLLKTLARQLRPEAGRVLLDGRDVAALPARELARNLGILFQENVAPAGLTVEALAYHGRHPHRGLFRDLEEADHAAVERALSLTGVAPLRDRAVDRLSGGQRQLAWLAMALAQEPRVLLLDEPTTFLDLRHQLEVMHVVAELRDRLGLTVAMVVHDVNHAARFADEVFALSEGRVVAHGPPAEVLDAALLRDVFGVEAALVALPDGTRVCVPMRPLDQPR
jgi:iron complex transport system ATP-binding protein